MSSSIEDLLAQIPSWRGKSMVVTPLSGGLTNTNYKVEVDGSVYVARVPGASTHLLAIDRDNERYNTRAAATTGVCPPIRHYLDEQQIMVLDFIPSVTLSKERARQAGMPTRIAQLMRRLHAGPRFRADFNMFRLIEQYRRVIAEERATLPVHYEHCLPLIEKMETAMARQPPRTVPCHNDLLPENLLDDGDRLWMIDFEYSGNNDPCFELGNCCQELELEQPHIVEMCAAYFGAPTPDLLARIELNMILSDLGWSLWGVIQAKISQLDVDFVAWLTPRWERAQRNLDRSILDPLLADV